MARKTLKLTKFVGHPPPNVGGQGDLGESIVLQLQGMQSETFIDFEHKEIFSPRYFNKTGLCIHDWNEISL